MHRRQIQNVLTSQDTPRAGGMRNVIKCCVITGHQEILKIEKSSRIRLNLPSNLSSISKFKRLSTKNRGLGNS